MRGAIGKSSVFERKSGRKKGVMAGLGNERGDELNAPAPAAGCDLEVAVETWPIRGGFTISRGAKHEAVVVVASLSDGRHKGRGECVPYARYGESVEAVVSAIAACAEPLAGRVEPRRTRVLAPGRRRPKRARLRSMGPRGQAAVASAPRRSPGWRPSSLCSPPSPSRSPRLTRWPPERARRARRIPCSSSSSAAMATPTDSPRCVRRSLRRGSSSMPTRPGNPTMSNRFLPPPLLHAWSWSSSRCPPAATMFWRASRDPSRSAPTSRCMTGLRSRRSPAATMR